MARRYNPRARRADTNNGKIHWQARWIWCGGEPSPENFYLYARRVFELKSSAERAVVHCTADSRYELYVNGHFVGRGPVRSHPKCQIFDTYDVTQLLTSGKNSIALLVHHYGRPTYSYVPGRGGMICQIEILHAGETTVIGTDEHWKVLPHGPWTNQGVKMSRRLGYQEVFDARLDPGDWKLVKYNDKKWDNPLVLGDAHISPWDNLVPRSIPHLQDRDVAPQGVTASATIPPSPGHLEVKDVPALMAVEEFGPLKRGDIAGEDQITSAEGHGIKLKGARMGGKSIILDFGREVSGRVKLDITGYSGGIVDIGYSEKLENGRIDPIRSGVHYSDRLIMRAGRHAWTTFESRGFRYMQIDFRDIKRPVHLHSVSVTESLYPVELQGSFESSDEMLNSIWKTGAETARLCMEDTYVDCPWRERGQWWADARIASHAAYYAFGDTALLGQGLRHIARSQREDGAVMALSPINEEKIIPGFAAMWVMSIWEHYAFTGDRSALFEMYPAVNRLMGWLGSFTDDDGLLANVEGWNFIDWGEIDTEGESTALNCLYYKALRRAEHIALALNRGADADRWNGLAALLRIAINKHMWSPAKGLYADSRVKGKIKDHFSRQTNVLAVLFDVADHYRKSTICRQLLNGGLPQIGTPFFMGFFTDALFRNGFTDDAIELIRKRWGSMIEAGATTFWEHFEPTDSLCHGWSASPTRDLSGYVLGVQPVAGQKRVRIEVHPGDLKWAKGAVPTPFGKVEIDWRMNRRDFTMTVKIPKGMTADLELTLARPGARLSINGQEQDVNSFELFSGTFKVRVEILRPSGKEGQSILDRNAKETNVEYLSSYQLWRTRERKVRRRGRPTEGEPEEEILTDEEIEYVESIDEVPPVAALRPGKGRVKPEEEEEPEQAEAPDVEPEKRKSRRRRGRRRGRGTERTPAEETAVEAVGIEPPVEEPAAVEAAAAPTEPEEKGRRSRSRRRGRKQPTAVETTALEAGAVSEPAEQPAVVEAAATVEHEAVVTTEQPAEPTEKPRRRTQRRRKKIEPAPEAPAEPVVEAAPEPVEAPVVAETAPEAPVEVEPQAKQARKPHRRRQTRKPKAEQSAEQVQETPGIAAAPVVEVEPAPVSDSEAAAPAAQSEGPAERPKRRSYRRPRKPKAEGEQG